MTKDVLIAKFKEYCMDLIAKQVTSKGKQNSEGGIMGALGSIGSKLSAFTGGGDSLGLMSNMKDKAEELIGQSKLNKDDVWGDLMDVAKSALGKLVK